jgi:hypothetical protein
MIDLLVLFDKDDAKYHSTTNTTTFALAAFPDSFGTLFSGRMGPVLRIPNRQQTDLLVLALVFIPEDKIH